ncbi:MAG: SDR family NAD(P)-dependent oxidoreductase, partial [Desulfobacterales bacterium]
MGIETRVALITGSASGMGKQTAQRMAENGAAVVINDIVPEKVEETVNEFRQKDFKVLGVIADICNKEAVDNMVEQTIDEFGRIDI